MDDDAYKVMHHCSCLLNIVVTRTAYARRVAPCSGAGMRSLDTASPGILMKYSMTARASFVPMSNMAECNLVDWPVCTHVSKDMATGDTGGQMMRAFGTTVMCRCRLSLARKAT